MSLVRALAAVGLLVGLSACGPAGGVSDAEEALQALDVTRLSVVLPAGIDQDALDLCLVLRGATGITRSLGLMSRWPDGDSVSVLFQPWASDRSRFVVAWRTTASGWLRIGPVETAPIKGWWTHPRRDRVHLDEPLLRLSGDTEVSGTGSGAGTEAVLNGLAEGDDQDLVLTLLPSGAR